MLTVLKGQLPIFLIMETYLWLNASTYDNADHPGELNNQVSLVFKAK